MSAIIHDEMQEISSESPVQYFHQMLNMAEDELNPYEYRLLGHYVRWAGHGGTEQEGIRQTASKCQMGTEKVESTRMVLEEKGYLKVIKPTEIQRSAGVATKVIVVDRWAENIEYIKKVYLKTNTPTPSSLPEHEGGVSETEHYEYPDSIQEVGVPTSVAATPTTAASESPSQDVATEKQVVATVTTTELAHVATEPNLPVQIPFRSIIVATEPEGEVVVGEPEGNKTKKGRKRPEGVTPAECINPMKAAIMKAFGWSWDTITKSEKGQVYNAAKQLCDVHFPPDEVQGLYNLVSKKFEKFTPVALTSNQSEYRKKVLDKQASYPAGYIPLEKRTSVLDGITLV